MSSSKRKELPTDHSTIVFTDSIANTMLPPVRFAAASIVINAAPVGNAQTNVRIMRKKAAHFFRSLPMCAADVPSAAPALWKNTLIMRIRHIWNTWKSVPNQDPVLILRKRNFSSWIPSSAL